MTIGWTIEDWIAAILGLIALIIVALPVKWDPAILLKEILERDYKPRHGKVRGAGSGDAQKRVPKAGNDAGAGTRD